MGICPAHAARQHRPHRRLQVRPHARWTASCPTSTTLARFGQEGVLCLLSDSTRAENPGYTPSERTVGEAFRDIMEGLEGRVIVATFASNIARIQQVFDAAGDVRAQGRGHRPLDGAEHAHRGRPGLPPAGAPASRSPRTASRTSPTTSWCIATTGAQGEPMAGLARMANRDHRFVEITPGRHRHRQRQPHPRQRGVRRRAPSTTCSRSAPTSSTTPSSAPTSRATPARRS